MAKNPRPTNDLIKDAVLAFLAIMARVDAPTLLVPCPVIGGDLVVPPIDELSMKRLTVWADTAPTWIGTPACRAILVIQHLSLATISRAAAEQGTPMRAASRQEIRRLINVLGEISADLTRAARLN